MKSIRKILIGCLCLFSISEVYSQAKEPDKIHLSGFSAKFGTYHYSGYASNNLKAFKKLASESELLKNNFDEFNQSFFIPDYQSQSSFSAQLYFDWNTKSDFFKQLNPKLRFGFTYAAVNLINGNLNRLSYFRIDTLTSNSDGKEYYVDSVAAEDYFLEYQTDVLYLNAALTIGSNPYNRWSFYAGLGIAVGMTFNDYVSIHYSNNRYFDARAKDNRIVYDDDFIYKDEYFSNSQIGFSALASMPLGLNFRLSKQKKFWKSMNLFAEVTPSVSYLRISDWGEELATSRFYMLGVKYKIQ